MESKENLSTIEIDLEEFSKQELITLILGMHKESLTFNQFIVKVLSRAAFEAEKLLEIEAKYPNKESF